MRSKLIEKLKKKNPQLNKSDFEEIIELFCFSIKKALIAKKSIQIKGFGTFFIKRKKENFSARNPKTGQLIYVPEKNKIRFKSSKKLKKLINE